MNPLYGNLGTTRYMIVTIVVNWIVFSSEQHSLYSIIDVISIFMPASVIA
jgi:hypothetical protein